MNAKKPRVLVLYNHGGKDEYENLKKVIPDSFGFTPEHPIRVAIVKEKYNAIVKAMRAERFRVRAVNAEENLATLKRLLHRVSA